MKYALIILLFTIFLYGCSSSQDKTFTDKFDLELDVINDILPLLIPEHSPCMLVPTEDEEMEEYNKRLEAFHDEVDSVGKIIEIVCLLKELDSNYIETYKRLEKELLVKHLLNAPKLDRRIDSSMIHEIGDLKIIFVKDARNTIGGLNGCYTFGRFNISRVGFNKDSTKAAFTYFIDDGSCTGGKGGIIDAQLNNGKWQIIK